MPRDYKLYLDDIIEAIDKILRYTGGMDFETFRKDEKTIDAVARNLEIIGEAARKLTEKYKSKAKNAEWRKITNLRNILVHEYFGINNEIIWDIIKNKIEKLKQECAKLL